MANVPLIDSGEYTRPTGVSGVVPLIDTGEYVRPASVYGLLPIFDSGDYSRIYNSYGVVPLLSSGDLPLNYSHAAEGGVRIGGQAKINYVLNGIAGADPLLTLTGSGGIKIGGAALVVGQSVLHAEIYPAGGVKYGGSAVVLSGWTGAWKPIGGLKAGGAANINLGATKPSPSLNAKLKPLKALFYAVNRGEFNPVLPPLTASFGGGAAAFGDLHGALLNPLTAAFGGGVTLLTGSLPPLQTSFTGITPALARLSGRLTSVTAEFTGVASATGTLAARTPFLHSTFIGIVGNTGSFSLKTPRLNARFEGQIVQGGVPAGQPDSGPNTAAGIGWGAGEGAYAQRNGKIPALRASFSGGMSADTSHATFNARLPGPIRFQAEGLDEVVQSLTLVVNTVTYSTVMYDNYPFNSFAEFNGVLLAAGPNGLYEIDVGNDDEGEPIRWLFRTGQCSFGTEYQKRIGDMYAAARSEGDVTLSVFVDETGPYQYTLKPYDVSRLKQRRSFIGKGAKGKYWQFQFSGEDNIELDSMNVAAVPLSRRL